jgi:hypothetical protein
MIATLAVIPLLFFFKLLAEGGGHDETLAME